jgi:hypothetical protein
MSYQNISGPTGPRGSNDRWEVPYSSMATGYIGPSRWGTPPAAGISEERLTQLKAVIEQNANNHYYALGGLAVATSDPKILEALSHVSDAAIEVAKNSHINDETFERLLLDNDADVRRTAAIAYKASEANLLKVLLAPIVDTTPRPTDPMERVLRDLNVIPLSTLQAGDWIRGVSTEAIIIEGIVVKQDLDGTPIVFISSGGSQYRSEGLGSGHPLCQAAFKLGLKHGQYAYLLTCLETKQKKAVAGATAEQIKTLIEEQKNSVLDEAIKNCEDTLKAPPATEDEADVSEPEGETFKEQEEPEEKGSTLLSSMLVGAGAALFAGVMDAAAQSHSTGVRIATGSGIVEEVAEMVQEATV